MNYFNNTKSNSKVDLLAVKEVEDPDEAMKILDKEIDKVKYKVFGKVSINKNKKKTFSKANKVFGQKDKAKVNQVGWSRSLSNV